MTITAFNTNFIPQTTGGTVSVSGVTNAATAFDWYTLTGGGALATSISSMSNSTPNLAINKSFVQSIAQFAKIGLLPLVKTELFASKFSSNKILINNSISTIINTLSSMVVPELASSINILKPSYTAAITTINTGLNILKSFENKIYSVSDSIDVKFALGTNNITSTYNSIPILTNFTNAKTYISQLLDPAVLNKAAIPTLTSVNGNAGNAAALLTIFTNIQTAMNSLTVGANQQAFTEMSAKNIFDLYAIEIQGYSSSGTTGKWASGSAPKGIIPGIDYEVHLTGNFQTGVASAGVAGAPSSITPFW